MDCIKIEVKGNIIKVTHRPRKVTSGTVGLKAEFSFDSQWDGLSKTAIFRACTEKRVLTCIDSEVTVPWEVLKKPGVWLSVGVYGTNTEGTIVIPTIWANAFLIVEGTTTDGDPSAEPTPGVWEQLSAEIEELKEAVENGGGSTGGGGTDKDGFSPIAKVEETEAGAVIEITDANGTTTATVKHGKDGADGKTPVKGVDYFDGEDGDPGYTPVKGTDYFTEEDKAEMVEEVKNALPNYVRKVNNLSPDENGEITLDLSGLAVDTSLTQSGMAADAYEVGLRFSGVNAGILDLQQRTEALEEGGTAGEGGGGSTEQLTNLSMVKSGDTITITSTLEGGDTIVDTITLTNGVPTSGVFNGVACTIEMEGF